jgi:hypothetical protein
MPVYLRRFYFNKLLEQKKTEKKQMDKQTAKSKFSIKRPNIPKK